MGRTVGKMAGSRGGSLLRARHLRNLVFALGLSAVSIAGAGLRANQLRGEIEALSEIQALVPRIVVRVEQVLGWLETEDDLIALPLETLSPLVARAAIAAHEMETLHDRTIQLVWASGRAGDLAASATENFDKPVHRIDMMMRSFLRGVARTAEATGSQRAAARRDLRELAQNGLIPAFERGQVTLLNEKTALQGALSATLALGGLGGLLGMMLAVLQHVRGPRRSIAELETRIDESMVRVEEVEVFLRGAERDRARMMDLSAAGLELPAERMRAAAGLLARTPLTETQGRVLHGLRQALAEIASRVEGLRVLASQGDGRLRLTMRAVRPGAVYAEWLRGAHARAAAEGKRIVAEPELDESVEVRGDELMIRRVLDRLLDDALRRSAKCGRVSIVAQMETAGRRWPEMRVVVEHDGAAPGPSEIAAIRSPFSSRPPSEAVLNRSVDPFALAVVAAICMATGGGLDISPRMKGGARAVARLRLAPASEYFDEKSDAMIPGATLTEDGIAGAPRPMEDPEGWEVDPVDTPVAPVSSYLTAQRMSGGQDRRRSRRPVPAPDPDPG